MRYLTIFLSICVLAVMVGCSNNSSPAEAESNQEDSANPSSNEEGSISSEDTDKSTKEATQENQSTNDQSAAVMDGIIPSSIAIPTLDVKANVIKVGTLPNGQMASPETKEDVGWYKKGAKPGEKGSAVFAGHVDSSTGPAVFYNLKDLKKGDLIHITNEQGEKLTFKVYKSKSYPRNSAPLSEIFGYTAARTVKLITCTGEFLDDVGTHEERLVVSAKLVENF